jgi:hypothetical protein
MSRFQRLSIVEKHEAALTRLRGDLVRCPRCQVGLLPSDLPGHEVRCDGQPIEPKPLGTLAERKRRRVKRRSANALKWQPTLRQRLGF